jgi:Gram-negative bacterial TonB protein C-terminal
MKWGCYTSGRRDLFALLLIRLSLCYKFRMRKSLLVIVAFSVFGCCAFGQADTALPIVTAFECPKYPSKAQSMHLQGMVELRITTDGHRATHIEVLPSHPILSEEAIKNVRTWTFADHKATSFVVAYYYTLEEHYKDKKDPVAKCSAKMDLPTKVRVSTQF